jgi:DNA-binding HxlR family transcriptional regulator
VRQYGQFCALAKALDVVGDRWTLLIVRELSIRPCRYTDLRDGLPGIATNLLADRLKSLEAAGVIVSEAAPPPIATTLYRLTDRGEGLLPAMGALGRWGLPLVRDRHPHDEFRPRWIVPAVWAIFGQIDVDDLAPVTVVLTVDDEPLTVRIEEGRVRAELGATPNPDLEVSCDSDTAFGLLSGGLDLDEIARTGAARVIGDRDAQSRFRRLLDRAGRSLAATAARDGASSPGRTSR